MFKIKEGISIGGKVVTGLGPTSIITAADLGTGAYAPAYVLPSSILISSLSLNGLATVTANLLSPAVLITQDGTGNALEVRDITGDATPFAVDASGNLTTGGNITIGGTVLPSTTTLATNLNADLLDGSHRDTAFNLYGSGTIPVRNTNGYLYSNFFNCTANIETGIPSHISIQTSSDNFIRWQTWAQFKINIGITNLESTGLGLTGLVPLNTDTNTAAEWASLPVGYARMFGSAALRGGVGNEGAPNANYGYFFKLANRDTTAGWAGLWIDYNNPQNFYFGQSNDGSTTATWYQVATVDTAQTLILKTITGLKLTRVSIAANDIDLNTGNFFTKTISGATTLTVSNTPTTGTTASFILELTNGGSGLISWWSSIKWAGGIAPTLTNPGVDILGFYTHDGGTTWRGLVLAKDSK